MQFVCIYLSLKLSYFSGKRNWGQKEAWPCGTTVHIVACQLTSGAMRIANVMPAGVYVFINGKNEC